MLLAQGEPGAKEHEERFADRACPFGANRELGTGVPVPFQAAEQVVVDCSGRLVSRLRVLLEADVAGLDHREFGVELARARDDVRHGVGETVGVLQDHRDRVVVVLVRAAVLHDCLPDQGDLRGVEAEVGIFGPDQPEHVVHHQLMAVSEEPVQRVQMGGDPGHRSDAGAVRLDEERVAAGELVVVGSVPAMPTTDRLEHPVGGEELLEEQGERLPHGSLGQGQGSVHVTTPILGRQCPSTILAYLYVYVNI